MTYYDPMQPDLRVVGLLSAGVPNQECIVLRPTRRISLAGFGITVALDAGKAGGMPLFDNAYWFPDFDVEPPCWLFVYTGKGKMQQTTMPNGEPSLVFHWQRETTLFSEPTLVPLVFSIASAHVAPRLPEK